MLKHTPGPWHFHKKESEAAFRIDAKGDEWQELATVYQEAGGKKCLTIPHTTVPVNFSAMLRLGKLMVSAFYLLTRQTTVIGALAQNRWSYALSWPRPSQGTAIQSIT